MAQNILNTVTLKFLERLKKTKKEQDRFVPGSTDIIIKDRYQFEWMKTCVYMYF